MLPSVWTKSPRQFSVAKGAGKGYVLGALLRFSLCMCHILSSHTWSFGCASRALTRRALPAEAPACRSLPACRPSGSLGAQGPETTQLPECWTEAVDTGFPRRRFLAASAITASGLVLASSKPRTVFAADGERQQESTNDQELPGGVVVLRVADVTETMENVVLQAAAFQESGLGDAVVIGRTQMQQSIKILLAKSKLEAIPKSGLAVLKLKSISRIAELGQGPLTPEELKQMAKGYSQARDALRPVFEQYPPDDIQAFKLIFARMQAADRATMQAGQSPE